MQTLPRLARIGSLRKINCSSKIAVAKFARWAARCYAGLALKALSSNCFATSLSPPTPHPQLRKINCTFAIALAEKFARWAVMCYAGFAPKSLLKVRCKACHAEGRAAFRSMHSNSAVGKPHNSASAASAKSIAPWQLHLLKNQLKNLHGGLRCATRGT